MRVVDDELAALAADVLEPRGRQIGHHPPAVARVVAAFRHEARHARPDPLHQPVRRVGAERGPVVVLDDEPAARPHGRRHVRHGRAGVGEVLDHEGVELLGPGGPAARRIEETREFFAFLQEELPAMMERWRERQAKRSGSNGAGSTSGGSPA
jgi:hypothetical protein